MWVHRTTPKSNFTAFRNELLADSRISLGAHGLLTYCLSLRNGTQVDIKSLACYFKDTQQKIAGFFHELIEVGYVTRRRIKDALNKLRTVIDVFDQVQLADIVDLEIVLETSAEPNLSGPSFADPSSYPSGKTGTKKPPRRQEPLPFAELGGEESLAPEHAAGAALLARVARIEPRLTLGVLERASLLPLVARWSAAGASDRLVVERLTQGLPAKIFSPVALMKTRLIDKMPQATIVQPRQLKVCDVCHRPASGVCGHCASEDRSSTTHSPDADDVTARGAARVRQALRKRSVLV